MLGQPTRRSLAIVAAGCLLAAAAPEEERAPAVLFSEDFERYDPGAGDVKTFASQHLGEVVEESFHPATGRDGERVYRLSQFIPRENPHMKATAYCSSTPFPATGKVKVSFWVKTKDASLQVSLAPAAREREQGGAVVIFDGSTTITGDLNEGWEFIEKEATLPPGVGNVQLVARLVSRTPNGLLYATIDDITVTAR